MTAFLSLILFFLYKAAIIGLSYYAIQYYKMRFDIVVFYFYLLLSLFQFLFVMIQLFGKARENKKGQYSEKVLVFQYAPIVTLLMELLALGLSGYYLYNLENDPINLLQIFTIMMPLHTVYYYFYSILLGLIIKKRKVRIKSSTIFPLFLFIIIIFFEPSIYMFYKYFYQSRIKLPGFLLSNSPVNITSIDYFLFITIMVVNGLIIFLLFYYKKGKARRIVSIINDLSLDSSSNAFEVDDPNECGHIESAILDFNDRLAREKANITLLNDFISKNIRNEITKSGLKLEGDEKTAAVATIRFSISLPDWTPENYVKLTNGIFMMIGEYADEYEAYPFFQLNKAVIVYGVPYYYEHEKYNAIEATQKTIGDMEKLIESEGGEISVHAGLFSGNVIVGAYNTRGRGLKEYSVTGNGVEMSEKISLAAENINAKLLVATGMIENLKNKFYPGRTFKLKMKNGEELVVSMIKV
jgi:hypothetical protein